LKILHEKNVINFENLDRFCEFLVEVQNTFSKEFTYIKPYNTSNVSKQIIILKYNIIILSILTILINNF